MFMLPSSTQTMGRHQLIEQMRKVEMSYFWNVMVVFHVKSSVQALPECRENRAKRKLQKVKQLVWVDLTRSVLLTKMMIIVLAFSSSASNMNSGLYSLSTYLSQNDFRILCRFSFNSRNNPRRQI